MSSPCSGDSWRSFNRPRGHAKNVSSCVRSNGPWSASERARASTMARSATRALTSTFRAMPTPLTMPPIRTARPERAPDALRRERQVSEAHAGETRQRVGDGRAHWNEAPLARALGAEGAAAIRVLHEVALELGRRIVGARHAIDEQRAVQEVAVLVEHLLEEGVAEPLDDAALVLPLEEQRVDRASDVGDRDIALDPHRARLLVHAHPGRPDRHFPERRAAAERRGGTPG